MRPSFVVQFVLFVGEFRTENEKIFKKLNIKNAPQRILDPSNVGQYFGFAALNAQVLADGLNLKIKIKFKN